MVDGFVAQLQSVFVVGCQVGHLCLQLAIRVTQQLCYQTLLEDRMRKINTCYLKQTTANRFKALMGDELSKRYLHYDIRRDAVSQQLVQSGSNL